MMMLIYYCFLFIISTLISLLALAHLLRYGEVI